MPPRGLAAVGGRIDRPRIGALTSHGPCALPYGKLSGIRAYPTKDSFFAIVA